MVTLIIDDQIEKSKTYDGLILSLNIGGQTDLNMSGGPALSNDQHAKIHSLGKMIKFGLSLDRNLKLKKL